MKLSIIIPAHNSAKTIIKTIKSIYSSYAINKYDFEVIVCDDFSLDGTPDIIKKDFPTVKILRLKEHKGAAAARNLGINNSTGDVFFVDSDVYLNKKTISTLIENTKVDIGFPKIMFENSQTFYPVTDIEKAYPHVSACFFIKRRALEKLDEYFDEFYQIYLEDNDFFMRCKLAGLKAKYVEEARVIHEYKKTRDFSGRYYLEVRNTIYGILKLRNLANRSGLYNPLTLKNLSKAFICGIFNFAWFNYQGYQRDASLYVKLKQKNPIFVKNKSIKIYIRAIIDIKRNYQEIKLKRKKIIAFFS